MTVRFLRVLAVALTVLTTAIAGPSPAGASPARGFVTRHGSTLELNGKPFRFAGTNLYWLGLDENVGGLGGRRTAAC